MNNNDAPLETGEGDALPYAISAAPPPVASKADTGEAIRNAALEEAAAECDASAERYAQKAKSNDYSGAAECMESAVSTLAHDIRAMKSATPSTIKPVQAVNTSPESVQETVDREQVASPFNLCAPFHGMDQPWTEEKKAELAAALTPFTTKAEPTGEQAAEYQPTEADNYCVERGGDGMRCITGCTCGKVAAVSPQGGEAPASLADGARYRCRKCGEQNHIEFNYARLVTHLPDGTPRDPRDIESDPAGMLIQDSTKPLLAAPAIGGEAKGNVYIGLANGDEWAQDAAAKMILGEAKAVAPSDGTDFADLLSALDKDACRYRFLRDEAWKQKPGLHDGGRAALMIGNHGEKLDRTIDDAMRVSK